MKTKSILTIVIGLEHYSATGTYGYVNSNGYTYWFKIKEIPKKLLKQRKVWHKYQSKEKISPYDHSYWTLDYDITTGKIKFIE